MYGNVVIYIDERWERVALLSSLLPIFLEIMPNKTTFDRIQLKAMLHVNVYCRSMLALLSLITSSLIRASGSLADVLNSESGIAATNQLPSTTMHGTAFHRGSQL
jgi:hypothetical protein